MEVQRGYTAVGTGVTTFLLVTVLVIEGLDVEFSAIVALPVGALTGTAVSVSTWLGLTALHPGARRVASAYATVGLTIVLLLTLRYINVGRTLLTVETLLGLGLTAGVVAYLALWLTDT